MNAATRPFAAAGVALMSAGFIAATPAIAPTTSALPQVHIPDLALQASIFDIFTFPAYQQAILNEVEFVAIRATGLAESAQGLAQSVFTLPGLGGLAVTRTFQHDLPVIQGVAVLFAGIVVAINLFVDLAYAWANPKVRT